MRNPKIKISLIIFSLITNLCWSQASDTITIAYLGTTGYEIDYSTIEKIQLPETSDYQGSYHFGESEGESTLDIIVSNGIFFAREQYAEWEKEQWVPKNDREYAKYVNGKLIFGKVSSNGKITFEKTAHELCLYKCIKRTPSLDKGEKVLVSHFFNNINGKVHHYIQGNYQNELTIPKGKYPETSFIKLTDSDITSYSKYDLKIMRNEIFARNGYIFKKGGIMDHYFSQKKWYNSIKKTNKVILDDIERHNVSLILKFEKQ
jgi:hypothetical protein